MRAVIAARTSWASASVLQCTMASSAYRSNVTCGYCLLVTFRQACVGRESSGQLPKEEANSHGDITVHLCLPGWSRHQMAATLAFVEGHSPDMNLLAFQRAGEVNGIGRDSPHQIRSRTHLAGCRFTRACFSTHHRPPVHWGDHATLATAAASSSVAR